MAEVSALDVLIKQEEAFENATHELDGLLRASPAFVRADVYGRASELARDSLIASLMLRECHADAVAELREEADQGRFLFRFGTASSQPIRPGDRLRVVYKTLFLFTRAYQDAIYGVLFELLTGNRAGNVRMQKAVDKPANPVGELLRSAPLNGYVEWFGGWRTLRNDVKEGTNFGLLGPAEDPGITFNTFTAGGGLHVEFRAGRVIKLFHAVEAMYWSERLARSACVVSEGRKEGVGVKPGGAQAGGAAGQFRPTLLSE